MVVHGTRAGATHTSRTRVGTCVQHMPFALRAGGDSRFYIRPSRGAKTAPHDPRIGPLPQPRSCTCRPRPRPSSRLRPRGSWREEQAAAVGSGWRPWYWLGRWRGRAELQGVHEHTHKRRSQPTAAALAQRHPRGVCDTAPQKRRREGGEQRRDCSCFLRAAVCISPSPNAKSQTCPCAHICYHVGPAQPQPASWVHCPLQGVTAITHTTHNTTTDARPESCFAGSL